MYPEGVYFMIYAIPYIAVFIAVLFLSLIEEYNSQCLTLRKDTKMLSVIIFTLGLFVFLGLRGLIGMDWTVYKEWYDVIPEKFSIKDFVDIRKTLPMEAGWNYFTIICRYLKFDYVAFQMLNFVIDFVLLYLIAVRYQKDHILLFFAFFLALQGYTFSLIILRNSKAIYIFILSLKYIKEKKFFRYEILCIIAFFFHRSALICMPLYFILGRRYDRHLVIAFFILGMTVFILQINWAQNFMSWLVKVLPDTPAKVKLTGYLQNSYYSGKFGLTLGGLERFVTFILFYKFQNILIGEDDEYIVEWNCYLLFIYVMLYFNDFYIIIERIPNYFIFTYWIFYPKLISRMDKPTKIIAYICFITYGILRVFVTTDERYYKYENILTGISTAEERLDKYGYEE